MSALPKDLQLDLLSEFQILPDDLASLSGDQFSQIKRDGILIHRVLHKNTIRDFLFRSKLPMTDDDQAEGTDQFWSMINESEKTQGLPARNS